MPQITSKPLQFWYRIAVRPEASLQQQLNKDQKQVCAQISISCSKTNQTKTLQGNSEN